MTPADRLTRAADTLDNLAAYATVGAWQPDTSGGVVSTAGPLVADTRERAPRLDDAHLIALTSDPDTVRLIAELLRDEAGYLIESGLNQFADDGPHPALALADRINERTTP